MNSTHARLRCQANARLLGDPLAEGSELVVLLRRREVRLADGVGDCSHDHADECLARVAVSLRRLGPLLGGKEVVCLARVEVRPEGGARYADLMLGGLTLTQIVNHFDESPMEDRPLSERRDHRSLCFSGNIKGSVHQVGHCVDTGHLPQPHRPLSACHLGSVCRATLRSMATAAGW